MHWLVEDPTLILSWACCAGGLAIALLRSGRGVLILAMALVATLMVAGLLAERYIVTEGEQVEDTLDAIARAIQANDHQEVMRHLMLDAGEIRRAAEANLSRDDQRGENSQFRRAVQSSDESADRQSDVPGHHHRQGT